MVVRVVDGVTEAPEKRVSGDDEMFAAQEADYAASDALLLGSPYLRGVRRLVAAARQRSRERGLDEQHAQDVASTTLESPEWNNTTVIEGDVAEALTRLKQEEGKNISVNGSATLVRSLLRDNLLDELRLFVHPIVLGSGERLFDDRGDQVALKLADSQPFSNDQVSTTYQPADESD